MSRNAIGEVTTFGIIPALGISDALGVVPNLGAGGGLSVAQSAFSGTFNVAANDTDLNVTFTARDTGGNPIEGYQPVITVDTGYVSATLSSVRFTPNTIGNDGIESASGVLTLLDEQGFPVVGQPVPGQANTQLALTNATNLSVTWVDTVTDRNGQARFTVVSTNAGERTVGATFNGRTITNGGTLIVEGSSPAFAFTSDFSTATGSGNSAVTDGGLWTGANINANFEVVAGAGVGFPTTNALRVDYQGTTARTLSVFDGWTMPPVGEYISRRIIFRNDHTESMYPADAHHPLWISDGTNACTNFAHEWFFRRIVGNPNQYRFEIANLSDGSTPPLYRWQCTTPFTVGTVYQVEERWYRVDSETYNLDVRVWDGNGTTILFDSSDFTDTFNSAGLLSQVPAPDILMPSTCGSGDALRNIGIIDQGVDFGAASYIYYGGVRILLSSDGQWCGPAVA